jgi:hypothetical protein
MKRAPTPTPPPSSRLLRAAAAEREQLERHRSELLGTRESLRTELERIEDGLREVEERRRLLDRLAPAGEGSASTRAVTAAAGATTTAPGRSGEAELLRGPAIRETAVRLLVGHPDAAQALHYRDWYALLTAAGYEVAGKDPLAVFLTQISRSPALRRGTRSGVYELDVGAEPRLRARLDRLHEELRLTASTSQTADLRSIRARRAELSGEIGQVEKALEELSRVLQPAA